MRAHTRCLTVQRDGDHLRSVAALQCGFVAMQGSGRQPVRRIPLRGEDAVLVLDDPVTDVDADGLRAGLDGPRVEVWSPVTLARDADLESLHLFAASQPGPYGILTVDRARTAGLLDPQDRFFCPTLLSRDSLAYLTMRTQADDSWQLGAHAFGPAGRPLAADLLDVIAAWAEHYRTGHGPAITVHPTGTHPPHVEARQLQLLVTRPHTTIALTWPPVNR